MDVSYAYIFYHFLADFIVVNWSFMQYIRRILVPILKSTLNVKIYHENFMYILYKIKVFLTKTDHNPDQMVCRFLVHQLSF